MESTWCNGPAPMGSCRAETKEAMWVPLPMGSPRFGGAKEVGLSVSCVVAEGRERCFVIVLYAYLRSVSACQWDPTSINVIMMLLPTCVLSAYV